MKIIRTITGLTMITLSSLSLAADSEVAAILKCKAMQGDAARLACYDALDSEASAKPPAPPSAPPTPAKSSADALPVVETATVARESAPVLDDDIGRENMAPAGGEQLTVRGDVVSCRENLTGKLVFTFASGQVWQQKDNKNPRWRDCEFSVTIRKDYFGYIMKPDNNDKEIRIARVK